MVPQLNKNIFKKWKMHFSSASTTRCKRAVFDLFELHVWDSRFSLLILKIFILPLLNVNLQPVTCVQEVILDLEISMCDKIISTQGPFLAFNHISLFNGEYNTITMRYSWKLRKKASKWILSSDYFVTHACYSLYLAYLTGIDSNNIHYLWKLQKWKITFWKNSKFKIQTTMLLWSLCFSWYITSKIVFWQLDTM